jgi:hypothetical protein
MTLSRAIAVGPPGVDGGCEFCPHAVIAMSNTMPVSSFCIEFPLR